MGVALPTKSKISATLPTQSRLVKSFGITLSSLRDFLPLCFLAKFRLPVSKLILSDLVCHFIPATLIEDSSLDSSLEGFLPEKVKPLTAKPPRAKTNCKLSVVSETSSQEFSPDKQSST